MDNWPLWQEWLAVGLAGFAVLVAMGVAIWDSNKKAKEPLPFDPDVDDDDDDMEDFL